MPNKTISVPDDVVPIIEGLGMPFSRWVTDQLRHYAKATEMTFADQVRVDGDLASDSPPSHAEARAIGARMGRTAPW